MNLESEMASAPVFFPGKFHGQGSLAGYSSRVCKASDMTEQLTSFFTFRPNLQQMLQELL